MSLPEPNTPEATQVVSAARIAAKIHWILGDPDNILSNYSRSQLLKIGESQCAIAAALGVTATELADVATAAGEVGPK